MNTDGPKKDRYIDIFFNMLEFTDKGILFANQVRAAGHFYNNKPHKICGKQILVTTDSREIRMFISDGLAYPPVRCPTDGDMESCTKVLLTPSVD